MQFEYNLVQPRGNPRGNQQTLPKDYTVEVVKPDVLKEDNEFTSTTQDPTAETDALDAIEEVTTATGLPEVGINNETEIPEGYKETTLGLLEQPINKTLERLSRNRKKTAKVRLYANYAVAYLPIALARAFTVVVPTAEPVPITILTTFAELQTLLEAEQ